MNIERHLWNEKNIRNRFIYPDDYVSFLMDQV